MRTFVHRGATGSHTSRGTLTNQLTTHNVEESVSHFLLRKITSRRWLARGIIALAVAAAFSIDCPLACAEDGEWTEQTFVYKSVGPTKIEADVRRRNGTQARPAVVWIHGGALIMGNRKGVPRNIVELCKANNYVLISIDYRLAPEVKLPAIIDDLKDAFHWIGAEGVTQLHLDTEKILVSGGSAGGYLTMMSGICAEPKPKALLAYWGYGDVDGPWYAEPAYQNVKRVSKEDAFNAVGGEVQTNGGGQRGTYYMYLRQNGLWPKEVTGFDPKTQREVGPLLPGAQHHAQVSAAADGAWHGRRRRALPGIGRHGRGLQEAGCLARADHR